MVLTSTHNLCFVQKYERYLSFLSENFQFLEIKFSIYLNKRVFVMDSNTFVYAVMPFKVKGYTLMRSNFLQIVLPTFLQRMGRHSFLFTALDLGLPSIQSCKKGVCFLVFFFFFFFFFFSVVVVVFFLHRV